MARACVNEQNIDGVTALMIAVGERRDDIVSVLLEAGALVNVQDSRSDETALMRVVRGPFYKAQREVILSLINGGARTDLQDQLGRTVFNLARPVTQKVIRTALKKRDRIMVLRYQLVREYLYGIPFLADFVFDYEDLEKHVEAKIVKNNCCLQ